MENKMDWFPGENSSMATREACDDVARYRALMDAKIENKKIEALPGEVELTYEAWRLISSTLKKCPKVAGLRKLNSNPIYHITICGFSLTFKNFTEYEEKFL